MPTPQELKAEIESGPLAATLAADYAAGNDVAVAARLNAVTERGLVPIRELAAYCAVNQITGGILALDEIAVGAEIAPGVSMTLQVKGLLKTVRTIVQDDYRLEDADVDLPAFGAALDGLIALGVMTSQQKAELIAMGANRYSRVQAAFGWDAPPVTAADVEYTRVRI